MDSISNADMSELFEIARKYGYSTRDLAAATGEYVTKNVWNNLSRNPEYKQSKLVKVYAPAILLGLRHIEAYDLLSCNDKDVLAALVINPPK